LLLPVLAAGAAEAASDPSAAAVGAFPRGELVEDVACRNDPTQSYTLYLPSEYSEERKWPALWVFDRRGRRLLAAEIFREVAEKYDWILLSSDNTRSDGPWEPNTKAVAAMWPDLGRYAVDPRRVYASGFSGGAMVAWLLGQQTRQLAGVIGSGGRPVNPARPDEEVPFAYFGAAGEVEFNYEPMRELDQLAASRGAPHRFEAFEGRHAWMPASLAREAVEWMELEAMRQGTRSVDQELVESLYRQDIGKAEELEKAERPLEAQRRYDAIARTFDGLREVDEAKRRASELAGSEGVKNALREEEKARDFESARRAGMSRAVARFRFAEDVATADRLAAELGLARLQKTADEDSYKGRAARRALDSLYAQLSFYQPRELFDAGDYARAAAVLDVATRIRDQNQFVWYNLASARAQIGRRREALAALERAVEVGYSDLEYMEQDSDLDPLRKLPGYAEIVARLRSQ
jgi:dienelactone hydrolase